MPGVVVARHDLGQLVAGVRRAREVRHRGERRVAVDARDDVVRHLAGRAAGAVRDRHERRVQRLELAHRLLELQLGRGRLRREELERMARPAPRGCRRSWSSDGQGYRAGGAPDFVAFRRSAARQPSEQNHTSTPSCTRCAGAFAFSTCIAAHRVDRVAPSAAERPRLRYSQYEDREHARGTRCSGTSCSSTAKWVGDDRLGPVRRDRAEQPRTVPSTSEAGDDHDARRTSTNSRSVSRGAVVLPVDEHQRERDEVGEDEADHAAEADAAVPERGRHRHVADRAHEADERDERTDERRSRASSRTPWPVRNTSFHTSIGTSTVRKPATT